MFDTILDYAIKGFIGGTMVAVGLAVLFVFIGLGLYIFDAFMVCMIIGTIAGAAKGFMEES